MNKFTLLLALFFGLTLSAQEKKFEDLFIPARESCWQKEQRLPKVIMLNTREQNRASLDSLISYWEEDCESPENLIRTRILHDLSKGQKLDSSVSLASFFLAYVDNLSYLKNVETYQNYLDFTTQWAEELLDARNDWGKREKLTLSILTSSRYQSALNKVYRASSYKIKDGREAGKALAESAANSSYLNITLGYNTKLFTQALEENLGQAHGFIFTVGANRFRHDFGIDFGLSFPIRTDSLRIDLDGIIQESGINSIIYFGLYHNYEFLKAPRTSLAFRSTLGYNLLTTDLDTYDEQNDMDVRFDLGSLSLGLGLEWKVRVYGSRQIGLRASYNYCNFSRNNELRSNLSGNIISSSLFFKF